ncbi:hypothetical protein ABFS82_07G052900 [Erythranthe guttata]
MHRKLNIFRRRDPAKLQSVPRAGSAKKDNPPPKILQLINTPMPPSPSELQALPRFGPLYSQGTRESYWSFKEEAWSIVEQSGGINNNDIYTIMGRADIEKAARGSYVNDANNLLQSEFIWMMIKDGCFFLHLALLLLGASDHLGYPSGHLIFGGRQKAKDINDWMKAMLFVGNQIPAIVIKELMKQNFFQQLVRNNQGKWEEPRGIFRLALYQLLGLPPSQGGVIIYNNDDDFFGENTTDLLHGLQCMVLGSVPKPKINISTSNVDFESGQHGIVPIEDGQRFPSAVEMEQVSISFKRQTRGRGAKDIQFSENFHGASLRLPVFAVGDDTELVFQSLIDYEKTQKNSSPTNSKIINRWGVSSYVRLMKDLVRGREDVKLLEKQGIITSCDLKHKDNLPGVLGRLTGCEGFITSELDTVRLLTTHYSRPAVWGNLKKSLKILITFVISFFVMFVLTFLQTFYTIYEYHHRNAPPLPPPPPPPPPS